MALSFNDYFQQAEESGFLEHISEIGTQGDFLHAYFTAAINAAETPEDRSALKRARDLSFPEDAARREAKLADPTSYGSRLKARAEAANFEPSA